jgi:hypothetical protein
MDLYQARRVSRIGGVAPSDSIRLVRMVNQIVVLWPPIVLTIRTSRMESARTTVVLWPPIVLTIRTSRMESVWNRE